VGGALVVLGESVTSLLGQVVTDRGMTTGADGRFELPAATDGDCVLWALHTDRGLSPPRRLSPCATEDSIELQLTSSGRLSGRVTQHGRPERASLWLHSLAQDGTVHQARTEPVDGMYRFPRLPPGEYRLSAHLDHGARGNVVREVSVEIAIREGEDAVRDFDLPDDVLLIVQPHPEGAATARAWNLSLLPGHTLPATPAALATLQAQGHALRQVLLGGTASHSLLQVHDVPPGDYCLCLEGWSGRMRPGQPDLFGCRLLSIEIQPSVLEVELTVQSVQTNP
jgi:hypothetical protein